MIEADFSFPHISRYDIRNGKGKKLSYRSSQVERLDEDVVYQEDVTSVMSIKNSNQESKRGRTEEKERRKKKEQKRNKLNRFVS